MILRQAMPNTEERLKLDGIPYTWGDYAKKCVSIVLSRNRFAKTIACVNNPYLHLQSIKDERELRRKGKVIFRMYL